MDDISTVPKQIRVQETKRTRARVCICVCVIQLQVNQQTNSPSKMDGSALENSSSIMSVITSSLPYLGITNVLRSALRLENPRVTIHCFCSTS